jgi:hypothetical protein
VGSAVHLCGGKRNDPKIMQFSVIARRFIAHNNVLQFSFQ